MTIQLHTESIKYFDETLRPDAEAKAQFDRAIKELEKSKRGKAILAKASGAKEIVNVVASADVSRLGIAQFMPAEFAKEYYSLPNENYILWDPKGSFTAVTDVEKKPDAKKKTPLERGPRTHHGWPTRYPPSVILGHELGHFCQYLGDLIPTMKVSAKKPGAVFIEMVHGKKMADIEHLNLAENEWPICMDMGLPLRAKYTDFVGNTDAPMLRPNTG